MKIKALIAVLVGAVGLQSASAGCNWCPPAAKDKCPVDCCEDLPGSISVGYASDYIFYGVRLAEDSVWGDVNYTFDIPCVGLPLTIGVWHLTSLGSGEPAGNDNYGDETDLYASLGLPSICGFDFSLGLTHYMFPTTRPPSNAAGTGGPIFGDSTTEISIEVSRELFCGVTMTYRGAHDFNAPAHLSQTITPGLPFSNNDTGAWVHTLSLAKTFDITDCIALDLSGGVLYTDNYWVNLNNHQGVGAANNNTKSHSGWNSYFIEAALPIAVGRCATLTPYIGYSGAPSGWVADGKLGIDSAGNGDGIQNANANDVFHGGVSLEVGF